MSRKKRKEEENCSYPSPEIDVNSPHRILHIESITVGVPLPVELILLHAKNLGISVTNKAFIYLPQAPTDVREMVRLLNMSTGAVLHDVDWENLSTLLNHIRLHPEYASRVVIMDKGIYTPEHSVLYKELRELGVFFSPKTFVDMKEVTKRIFGVGQDIR